jgi:hypothetical protein
VKKVCVTHCEPHYLNGPKQQQQQQHQQEKEKEKEKQPLQQQPIKATIKIQEPLW